MKDGLKICTIGGGSSYTPELMNGFIKRYDRLPVREIWLVDVERGREKLEIVGALAQRMWDKSGHDVKVHLTLDRREALRGADFVTTQFRVGLLEARIKDERIEEPVLALGSSPEPASTALMIDRMLAGVNVKRTRLARGIPMGSDLEFVDEITMLRAFEGRVSL